MKKRKTSRATEARKYREPSLLQKSIPLIITIAIGIALAVQGGLL